MKPLIALSARSMKKNPNDIHDLYYVQGSYMEAVECCGGTCISIIPNKDQNYKRIAKMCDGLLLCGGLDSNSKLYNEPLHEKSELVSEEIDSLDLKLIEAFLEERKPILGICRGLQILNIYYGGSLYQDLPSQYQTNLTHSQSASREIGTHTITLCKDSFLGEKNTTFSVNSFHHQAIKTLGKNLTICAYSEDGIVEAIENEFIQAVQWHPECMIEDPFHKEVIQNFIDICKKV